MVEVQTVGHSEVFRKLSGKLREMLILDLSCTNSLVNFPGMTGCWHKELISYKI